MEFRWTNGFIRILLTANAGEKEKEERAREREREKNTNMKDEDETRGLIVALRDANERRR
jgi:hypothetical protein